MTGADMETVRGSARDWGAASTRGLHGQVVEQLGSEIVGGNLPPGARIETVELVPRFQVSRTVVREALRVLEAKGLIAARPRAGTMVRPHADWNVLDSDVIRWRAFGPDAHAQFEELLDLRGAIEPLAARKAATSKGSTTEMTEALERMTIAVSKQDQDAFTDADVAFHHALLISSGSRTLRRFVEPIESAIRARHRLNLMPEVISDQVLHSHASIIEAVQSGDALRAELSSRRIVDVAGAETLDALLGPGTRAEEQ